MPKEQDNFNESFSSFFCGVRLQKLLLFFALDLRNSLKMGKEHNGIILIHAHDFYNLIGFCRAYLQARKNHAQFQFRLFASLRWGKRTLIYICFDIHIFTKILIYLIGDVVKCSDMIEFWWTNWANEQSLLLKDNECEIYNESFY